MEEAVILNKDKRKEYLTMSLYAVVVLVVSAAIIFGFITDMNVSKYIGILKPFVYAFAIAYLLSGVVKFFMGVLDGFFDRCFGKKDTVGRARMVKYLSITLAYIVFGLALYIFSIVIFPQLYATLKDLISNYRSYGNAVYAWITAVVGEHSWLPGVLSSGVFEEALTDFTKMMIDAIGEFSPKALSFIERFANEVKNILFAVFISIYMLIGKETFKAQSKKLLRAFLTDSGYNKIIGFFRECDLRFGGFIVGKIIDSTIIGILCYICCLIFGFPFAALISFIIGFTNIVPIAGPFIGAIPSAFLILLTAPEKVLWFILFVLVLQQLDGNFIGPKILGDRTGLSAFWVLTALVIMGGLYGVIGMVLAVPVCSVIYYEVKIVAERKLAEKSLPTDTQDYSPESERLLVTKTKSGGFSVRMKNHLAEMAKHKKKDGSDKK